ncbi:MAG TPA: hypothetical protein VH208_03625 [Myxococcaceae bacterium]|nr:hypothetical protein [Myxococcaceae bacterium]
MATHPLVVCEACGRPQFLTQPSCVGCGAKLPEAPATGQQIKSARDRLIDGYQPYIEADFGRGRLLLLSEKQLEWRVGAARPLVAELTGIEAVSLHKRRVWEALLPAALVAGAAAWPAHGWPRWALAAFAGLWVVAGALQRRATLVVQMKDGRRASIPLGIGGPAIERADSVWSSVGPELARSGIAVSP